jgi:DNA polymerase III delta subunit
MANNIYVIISEDDYLVKIAAKKIYEDESYLEVIDSLMSTNADSQLADIAAADSSFMQPPFLEPKKVTWWKNVGFLPSGGKKSCSEEVKCALEKFALKLVESNLPDNQAFILSGSNLLVTSVFAKTLKTGAVIQEIGSPKGKKSSSVQESVVRVIDFASELGLLFAPGAADVFVGVVGNDARSEMNELEKLKNYLGGRNEISVSDIHDITSPGVGIESVIWNVTDAIAERNASKAISAMKQFAGVNGYGIMMSNAIEKCFRQLVLVKDTLQRSGSSAKSPEGLTPWQFQKLARNASKWTLLELRRARHRFVALRESFVSGAGNIPERLEIEVALLCTKGK